MLIRNAEIEGEAPVDLRITDRHIAATGSSLKRSAGELVLDAEGGALLPGLHDHHLHLFALAAALDSVRCGPPDVQTAAGLEQSLRAECTRQSAASGECAGASHPTRSALAGRYAAGSASARRGSARGGADRGPCRKGRRAPCEVARSVRCRPARQQDRAARSVTKTVAAKDRN